MMIHFEKLFTGGEVWGGVTSDLTNLGSCELDIVGELLRAFRLEKDKTRFLGDEVQLLFNPYSGCVFLSDEDYNVAMMNGDLLEDFFSCPECGHGED